MEWIVERDYAREALPKRDPEGHKGSFGEVLALAGSAGYTGAAWLTAAAASFTWGCRRTSGPWKQ